MDVRRKFGRRIDQAREALDVLDELLTEDRVPDDEVMEVVQVLDKAGLLIGWDGPELDELRRDLTGAG